jgi:hypothetical protein
MDTDRVFKGAIIWSLGLLVPGLYHSLLMLAAVQEDGFRYSFSILAKKFFQLPWIVWPYLIAMAGVGAILIVSGLMKHKD